MRKETFISIVFPFYNESERLECVIESIYNQKFKYKLFDLSNAELIFVDNNSTDDSVNKIIACQNRYNNLDIHIINEKIQGVSSARKKGMDYASLRAEKRLVQFNNWQKHYIVSADADCTVDQYWLDELIYTMITEDGDLGTCNYFYEKNDFIERPNLYKEINKTLRCRDFSFSLFGGFPDGKGFAVKKKCMILLMALKYFTNYKMVNLSNIYLTIGILA